MTRDTDEVAFSITGVIALGLITYAIVALALGVGYGDWKQIALAAVAFMVALVWIIYNDLR